MDQHKEVRRICDTVLEDLFKIERLDKNRAMVCALYARYLKRVSAQLKNIATSVVQPFDQIGYTRKEKGLNLP